MSSASGMLVIYQHPKFEKRGIPALNKIKVCLQTMKLPYTSFAFITTAAAYNSVIDTCRKTASYRAVSHFFPADNITKTLCGTETIKETENAINYVKRTQGHRQASNLREGFGVRHNWINKQIEACMQTTDTSQVVIFGAGFDTRAYALQCLKQKHVFEIDLPEIIDEKNKIIDSHGFRPFAASVTRISYDLGNHGVMFALCNSGFDPLKRTCYIFEGILYYLYGEMANTLLRIPLAATGNTVLLDTVTPKFYSEQCQAMPFIKSGIEMPHKHLRRMGYNTITVDQIGDHNANFGALDTFVPHAITSVWAYKYNLRITNIDGIQLIRFFLVKAFT